MPNVGQKDILEVTGEVLSNAPAGSADFMSQASKLIDGANSFIEKLSQLSNKTGLPVIGDDAAIRRFMPADQAKAKPAPTKQPPAAAPAPMVPAPPAAAKTAPPDFNKILNDAEAWLQKQGLSELTVGQVLAFVQDKKLGDLLSEVKKHGTKP